jgi:methionyl-tRNA formyltransferase
MEITKKMDAGDIYAQEKIEIFKNDDINSLSEKLSFKGAKLLIDTLIKIKNKKTTKTKQDENKASYCKKIQKEDGKIIWATDTSDDILNKIKAYSPWPSCYTFWNNKKIKIISAEINSKNILNNPGKTFLNNQNGLCVATIDASIVIKKLQLEGKKILDSKTFLMGYKDIADTKLL